MTTIMKKESSFTSRMKKRLLHAQLIMHADESQSLVLGDDDDDEEQLDEEDHGGGDHTNPGGLNVAREVEDDRDDANANKHV